MRRVRVTQSVRPSHEYNSKPVSVDTIVRSSLLVSSNRHFSVFDCVGNPIDARVRVA